MAMFGDDGWAVTYDLAGPIANLLRTGDGGHTWRMVTPRIAQGSFIFGVAPIGVTRAWLMAAGATEGNGPVDLWATADGGQTWSKTTGPGIAFRGALITFVDGANGWLATPGEPGGQYQQQGIVIDRTNDGGKTWQLAAQTNFPPARSTAGAPSLDCGKSDLSFINPRTGWLTGGCSGGITFDVTTDGGATWQAHPLLSPGSIGFQTDCEAGPCTLTAPRFLSPGFGYMVLHDTGPDGNRSWFYASGDGGQSWTIHSVPGQETTISMITSSVGFASVGPAEFTASWLYRTDDGGASWQPVLANIQVSYMDLDCVSAMRCWALSPSPNGPGSPTSLYETTDGGRTWSTL